MEREKLREMLNRRPFEPFCLYLADGRTFEIRFPEINLLCQSYINSGIPEPDNPDPYPERFEYDVPLAQITRAEPLTTTAPPAER
jgi:hypothetical protein